MILSLRSLVSYAIGALMKARMEPEGQEESITPNFRAIRVMCSGRIDPQFVLEAFKNGACGVLMLGCHPGTAIIKKELSGAKKDIFY